MDFSSFVILTLLFVAVVSFIRHVTKPVMYLEPAHTKRLRGKTAIVTGANSGIGFETATELAMRGARVILACRDLQKAKVAASRIGRHIASREVASDVNHRVLYKQLDLASLKSVRTFAEDMTLTEGKVDLLINNAGMFSPGKRVLTSDGLELTMATNHFGHFLLTNLLLPLLQKSENGRILVVSSWTHTFVPAMDFTNLNSEKHFSASTVYSDSKLANMLFVHELAKRLQGTNVTVNALHPGFVDTPLYRSLPQLSRLLLLVMSPLVWLFARTALEGAQTSIFLAESECAQACANGRYFYNCKQQQPSPAARDDAAAKKLWEISEKLTGFDS